MTAARPCPLPTRTRRRVLAAALGALLALPLAAQTARDDGQRALAAREGGRILPLDALIVQVDALIPGRLLEAELDDEDGVPVYELRWQLADGRRLEIEIDARNGQWRKLEGARLETVFRRAPASPGAAR